MVGEPGGQLRRLRGRPDAGGKGPRAGGWERRRAGSGRLLGRGPFSRFCQANRRAGGGRSQGRDYTCKCQHFVCIGHISGPAPMCAEGQGRVAGSGGLWHPLHEAADQGREEGKALAPGLSGFARQPCASPASFCAAPFCPPSLSLPFCERRKLIRHLQICLRASEILHAQAPAGPPRPRQLFWHRLAAPAVDAAWGGG